MNPINLAATAATAIVNLLTTDTWGKAEEKISALWHRFHPEQTDAVEAELAQAHNGGRGGDATAVHAQALTGNPGCSG